MSYHVGETCHFPIFFWLDFVLVSCKPNTEYLEHQKNKILYINACFFCSRVYQVTGMDGQCSIMP